MKSKDNPYCIPHKRELSRKEVSILQCLLANNLEYYKKISRLKVVARCGCGNCPTVLFANSFDSKPLTGTFNQIAESCGTAVNGTLVGVAVLEREGQIAELEAWSVCGGIFSDWPSVEALSKS